MRIVVTGASGQLGSSLLARLAGGPHHVIAWTNRAAGAQGPFELKPVDLTDAFAVSESLVLADADVVIHAAAVTSSEVARREPDRAWAVNVKGTRLLADWAARSDRRLLFTSTDLVFDGHGSWYREDDPAEPILEYGRTKRAAELLVLAVPRGLVARLSLLYGSSPAGKSGYFDRALVALEAGVPQAFYIDEFRTPLGYDTAAGFLIRLAESDRAGLIHVGGRERLSRFELMRRAAIARGISPHLVLGNRRADVELAEPRPADVSLDTSRLRSLFPDAGCPGIEVTTPPAGG
jgi:dTDP-4-dehydrorhamnose reductase